MLNIYILALSYLASSAYDRVSGGSNSVIHSWALSSAEGDMNIIQYSGAIEPKKFSQNGLYSPGVNLIRKDTSV